MNFLQDSNLGVFNNIDFTILYGMVVHMGEASMANINTIYPDLTAASNAATLSGHYSAQTLSPSPQWQMQPHVTFPRTMRDCAITIIRMVSLVDNDLAIAVRLAPRASLGNEFCVYLTVNDHNGKPTPVMFPLDRIEEAAACKLAAAIMVQDHKAILDLYVIQMAMDMASGKHPE